MPISAGPRERVRSTAQAKSGASLHFTASFRDQGRPVVRVATIVPWPSRPGLSARTWARNATTTCRGWDRFCGGRTILVRAMHPARFSTRCGGRPAALRKEGISYCNLRPCPGVKVQALQPEWLTSRLDTWFVGHTDPWRGHRRPVSSQARSIPPPTRGPHPVRPYRPCPLAVAVTARHPRMVCGPRRCRGHIGVAIDGGATFLPPLRQSWPWTAWSLVNCLPQPHLRRRRGGCTPRSPNRICPAFCPARPGERPDRCGRPGDGGGLPARAAPAEPPTLGPRRTRGEAGRRIRPGGAPPPSGDDFERSAALRLHRHLSIQLLTPFRP